MLTVRQGSGGFVLPAVALFFLVAATAPLPAQTWDPQKFMGVDEIRRGDKGYILTVLEGTKVEKLDIEIFSVEKQVFPKGDLIWATGLGDRFQHMGTVAGMSGSPAYINGRLIGALAYGYYFAKDPVIGITPIAQMLRVWTRNMTPRPIPRTRKTAQSLFVSPSEWVAALTDPHNLHRPDPVVSDEVVRNTPELDPTRGRALTRIQTPLMLAGFSRGPFGVLEDLFRGKGMVAIQGAGGGRAVADAPVEGGSALGVEFIRGDLSAFGYGTVTYRDGDRILAFGHPMFGEGDIYLPMSGGYVHYVLASVQRSFKVASATRPVGTLVQDREPAIAGVVQEGYPPYVPLAVTIRRPEQNAATTYAYELLRHEDYTGGLAYSAVWSTLDSAEKMGGDYTLRANVRITFDSPGYAPFEKSSLFSGNFSPGLAAGSMASPIMSIASNWFEEIPIRDISVEVDYQDQRHAAVIESARLSKLRVRPGDAVQLSVLYRPYLDDPILKRYDLIVPRDAPDGPAMVFLGDANAYEGWSRSRARDRYQATNARQLLELLARGGQQDHLRVELLTANMGVALGGEEMPNLPLSMLTVMNTPTQQGESNLTRASALAEMSFATPFVLSGSTLLPLIIDSEAP